MIIREREDAFVMIEQKDHALISGDLFANWQPQRLASRAHTDAVRYAITNHDYGWHALDQMPFWNDVKGAPYNFMDFPAIPKLIFYKYGIDELENLHPYAGLLASRHYVHLTTGDGEIAAAQEFIKLEQARQDRLKQEISDFDDALFEFHYAMLAICDNLSLFLCLNEPGISKAKEHPLFQQGIPIPAAIKQVQEDMFTIQWDGIDTIQLNPFPLQNTTTVQLKQRVVSKQAIKEKGLIESYTQTPIEERNITFTSL